MNRTQELISLSKDKYRQQIKRPGFLIPICLKIGSHGLLFRIFIWIFLIQPLSLACSALFHFSTSLAFAFVLYAVTCYWPGVPFICGEVKRLFPLLAYQERRFLNLFACVMSWMEEALLSLTLPPLGFMSFWMYTHAIIPYLIAGLIVGTVFPLCLLPRRLLGGEPTELDN